MVLMLIMLMVASENGPLSKQAPFVSSQTDLMHCKF